VGDSADLLVPAAVLALILGEGYVVCEVVPAVSRTDAVLRELFIAYCNRQILKLVHDPQARCVVQYSLPCLL
jgi:hypothetical protein